MTSMSAQPKLRWWARQGSNLRPIGYEPTALPLSYEPLKDPKNLPGTELLHCPIPHNSIS